MERTLPTGRFCGTCLVRRDVGGLLLMETRYGRGHETATHAHEQASFSLVLDGAFEHRTRGASVACGPATLLLHDAGEPHSERFRAGATRCLIVELGAPWMHRVAGHAGSLGGFASFSAGPAPALAMQLHRELREPDDVSALAIEGVVLQLLATARRSHRRADRRRPLACTERVREMLHSRFRERLSLAELADAAGLHPVTVAHAFREAFGQSVGAYQRRLRIEFACRELAHRRASIAEVALAAGFYDQSHFTRTFRRCVGTTPARYRAGVGAR